MPCKTAGGFVGLLVELAAELEHRHHAFERRSGRLLGMRASTGMPRPSSVDGDRAVGIDRDVDDLGVTGHHFVDRVIDDFVHQVMQAADVAVADVHARSFADVLEIAHVAHLIDAVFAFDRADGGIGGGGALGLGFLRRFAFVFRLQIVAHIVRHLYSFPILRSLYVSHAETEIINFFIGEELGKGV